VSVINPVQLEDSAPPLITLGGGTDLTLDSTATQGGRLVFAGGTALSLQAVQHGTLTLAGGTALSITGPQSFGTLALDGSTSLTLSGGVGVFVRLPLDGSTSLALRGTYTVPAEFGFAVFVDVLSAALSNALSNPANIRRFTARLLADGTSVPIIRAGESGAADRLGTELTVILARPDVSAVALSASVDFEIGVWTGADFEYVPRLTGARLSGRGARYTNEEGLPADSVELSFVDVLGDRWNRRPAANTLLYNPDKVDAPQSSALSELSIFDERGGAIAPDVRALSGLSLLTLLDFAYVEGCGFDKVITNVEDFPIEQAAVTITGGYDAAVRPFLSSYDIVPKVVGNDLWLLDTSAPLPAGLSPRAFPSSLTLALEDALPPREPVTAILVHLKGDSAGDYTTERVETPPSVESGSFGSPGYTAKRVERRVREWRAFAAPETILREEVISEKTTLEDFEFNIVSRETRDDSFDALGRHTGYERTVEQRLPDVSAAGAMTLQRAATETQLITYTPDPRDTRRDLQDRVETRREGLILVDEDKPYLGKAYRLPLGDAHRSGYVDPDANQRTEFGHISTEFIELKIRGQQVTRERRLYDAIADTVDPSSVQTLPADNSVERRGAQTRSVLVRLDGAGPEATLRRVPEFDGTGVPDALALKLARRRLALLNSPQREANVRMAFVDPLMRRSADLRLYGRAPEAVGDYIVRGYSTVFSSEGGEFDAQMTIQAKELRQ
jgi:hypothetical protein